MTELEKFKYLIDNSRRIVGFTGAGMSTESGISDYRSQGGIWEKFTPVYLTEFINDPEKRILYWQRKKALWESIKNAKPGKAHYFFEKLHRQGRLHGLITQNIDGLHEKSGLPTEADCQSAWHNFGTRLSGLWDDFCCPERYGSPQS